MTAQEWQSDMHKKVEEDMADAKAERDRYLSVVRPSLYRWYAAGVVTGGAAIVMFQQFT